MQDRGAPAETAGSPSGMSVLRTIAMPADTNPAGDIFGGWLMAQMDFAAGNVAARRARGRCATVVVESMAFYSPVFVGDEVSLFATITGTGRSSIRITVEAWRRDRTGEDMNKVTQAPSLSPSTRTEGHVPFGRRVSPQWSRRPWAAPFCRSRRRSRRWSATSFVGA